MMQVKNMTPPDLTQQPVVGILLAAGFSRRFGQHNKLLHPLSDGQQVALSAANALIQALPNSIAVIRDRASALVHPLKSLGFKLAYCETQHQHMSDSLKLGIVTAESEFPQMSGLVIALADMPYIKATTIARVAQHLAHTPIVQPIFHNQPGHPVGFASDLMHELRLIEGDQGARSVLQAHSAEIFRFECEDAGILKDIDTPADLP